MRRSAPSRQDMWSCSPPLTAPVPPSTWDWLFAHLPPVRLLEVGGAAQWRDNEQMAERAWTRAFEIGDERVQTVASVGLGDLLETRGITRPPSRRWNVLMLATSG
jgi:hypothetical protein